MFEPSGAEYGDERRAGVALPQIQTSPGSQVVLAAFTAGQAAKAGSREVETAVGSIRSRARGGGWGLLSLLALMFPMLKEAQAADSNVTLLDDDNITYKDSEHGSFELITKEPIPRHIIVEDPGQTVIVRKIGSSVSVEPVGNTAARMEELQLAQQDALANWAKGLGHGSSAPPFSNPDLELQPINFIQNDDSPAPGGSLTPIQATFIRPPDIFILPPPPPTVAITSIAGQIGVAADNVINAAKADAGVEITGTTSGVENGQLVKITIVDSSNHVVYSGTATVANSFWLVNLSPAEAKSLADGIYTLTADVSNTHGDPADASRTIRVDETPPAIAIDCIVRHNVVNANAASAGFAIAGTVSDAENGQPVTVKIIDSSGQVVDTFTTALTNNTWSVNVSPTEAKLLHDGSYMVTADVSDTAGNPAPEATQAVTVDETPPKVTWSPQAECGIEGSRIALGAITATANILPGHSNSVQSLVVSGIPVGAVLTDCTNCFTATSGDTSIDVKSWNLSNLKIIPPNDTNFTLTVTATDQDANSASANELVKVAPLSPCLDPVAAHGNEDTAIVLDLGVTAKSLSGANGDVSPNSLDTLVVKNIPLGATLTDGTGLPGHSFTATAGNTSHDVASWSLSCLKITPPAGFEGCFTLTIAATDRDSEGDVGATVTACEVVKVAKPNDTSLLLGNSGEFTDHVVGFAGDALGGALSASQAFTSSPTGSAGEYPTPMHGIDAHSFEQSVIAQVATGGSVDTVVDSFRFKDENSGSRDSAVSDIAELEDTHVPMNHHEYTGTDGPLAISEGVETPGAQGSSFHFKDEKGLRPGAAELCQAPASTAHHQNGAATDVPPAILGGAHSIELPPPEQHLDDHFNIVPSHAPSALATQVSHDLIV